MSDAAPDGAVAQARAARDAGAPWRARDLLLEHVQTHRDPEALALLGEVLQGMGDLPRAGAVWFAAGAKGPHVDESVAAWREQAHDDFGVMWRSLPASVRAEPRPRRIEALRERARAAQGEGADTGEPTASDPDLEESTDDDGFDASWLAAWVLAIAFVLFAVIGFVTVLGWVVPG
jgi:hypothetical protein